MRFIDGLSTAQRVVIVIALGLALGVAGRYLVSLGGGLPTGWTGYAPLQAIQIGMAPWLRLVIWLALIVLWSLASIRVLRPSLGQSGSD
jgi:heme/copper-type cytochrome/quinol oxidase subunit 1